MNTIEKDLVLSRMSGIALYVQRLEEMKKLPVSAFLEDDNFAIAAYNLRSALEAVFDIAGHILSRIPGAQMGGYKEMAQELGKRGIVPTKFAQDKLQKMGGYRNRLTHFYFEVKPEEIYEIIQNDLEDFTIFIKSVKNLLKEEGLT